MKSFDDSVVCCDKKKLNVKQFQFKQHNTSETDVTYEKV